MCVKPDARLTPFTTGYKYGYIMRAASGVVMLLCLISAFRLLPAKVGELLTQLGRWVFRQIILLSSLTLQCCYSSHFVTKWLSARSWTDGH